MKRNLLALLFLAVALPALGQTKFSIFDQVTAKGAGLTPAKGQLFYTSNTSGTITPLTIGNTNDCLIVNGSGLPEWSNVCIGALSSVGLSMPAQFSLSNNPLTSNGTIGITWQTVSQNYVLAGPTSGTGAPSFRSIVLGDLSQTVAGAAFNASGTNHSMGLVPDPGAAAGTTKFLREDATWSTTGSGTVTSVALGMPSQFAISGSPVTTTGTLTAAWNTQNANKFLAGPTSGGASAPTFRSIVGADVGLSAKGDLLTWSTALAKLSLGTDGYVLMADSGEATGLRWAAVGGTGTVTSVALSMPAEFNVTGSPVTADGTLSAAWANQTGTKAFMGGSPPAFRNIAATDLPSNSISGAGIVSTAPNDVNKFWRGDATWGTPPGSGTVTSVALSAPSWYTVTGSPVTTTGTLAFAAASGQTANRFLATPDGSTGAISLRAIAANDLPLNTTSQRGAVSTAPNDAAKFWRGDATWAAPAFVTSVSLSAPSEISVSGVPITSSGTINLGWAAATANQFFAGPTGGAPDTPAFRALIAGDYPTFIASGASHAKGAVPDPPASSGSTKYLREDATWAVPSVAGAIEVKEEDGSPDVTNVSTLRFDQATGFSVTDNGSGVATVACSGCGGGGTTAMRQDGYVGDGGTTIFTLGAAPAADGIVFVSLNGLPQPTSAWSLGGSNITMTTAPISGALLEVGYYTSLPGTVTHAQEDFTGDGSTTDFTLAHTPATNGVLLVSLRGLVQTTAGWTLVGGGGTLRMLAAPKTGDTVSISYNY